MRATRPFLSLTHDCHTLRWIRHVAREAKEGVAAFKRRCDALCKRCKSPGASTATASAARTTACWAGPLGAVKLLDRPSWLTALPRSSMREALSLPPLMADRIMAPAASARV